MTVVAKAAVSLPELPNPFTSPAPAITDIVLTAGEDEGDEKVIAKSEELDEDAPPPVIAGLSDTPGLCETPEEVLRALSKERELIAERMAKVDAHEAEVTLAREKLDIEKAALVELKGSIETLLAKIEAQQTDDVQRLIDFYKNMKPAEAASLMNEMDIEVTIMVLGTMSPRTAAPILAKMTPVRARAVSKIILERSQLPGDQDLNGVRLN
ncbi:MotE family protein [Cognatishimia sp.]|uniref:MotE family protein n=1 Tax=Cognatishimia sp. TaxID=2211648 RepID=UPI003516C7E1